MAGLNASLDDGQSQSYAAAVPIARPLGAVEGFKDALQIVLCDPGSLAFRQIEAGSVASRHLIDEGIDAGLGLRFTALR